MKVRIGVALALSRILLGQYNTCGEPERFILGRISSDLESYPSCSIGGDPAAKAINNVTSSMGLDDQIILRILRIVEHAFYYPEKLENAADREPKETLLLLDRLNVATMDAALKAKISKTRSFILERIGNAAAKDSRQCPVANYSLVWQTNGGAGAVYRALRPAFPGQQEPDAIPIRWMGDEVADSLNAVVGECTLNSQDTKRVLEIIRGAFSHPDPLYFSQTEPPAKVFAFLDNLDSSTKDSGIKAEIAETRLYVLAQLGGR